MWEGEDEYYMTIIAQNVSPRNFTTCVSKVGVERNVLCSCSQHVAAPLSEAFSARALEPCGV